MSNTRKSWKNFIPDERKCPRCSQVFTVGGRGNRKRNQTYCSRYCNVVSRSREVVPKELSPIDAAYLAAFIDGEGTVIQTDPEARRKIWRIVIHNTYLETMEWILEVVGTGTLSKKPRRHKLTYKPCYTWQVYGYKALLIAKQLLPYMKQKKDKMAQLIHDEQEKEDTMINNRVNQNDRRVWDRPKLCEPGQRGKLTKDQILFIYKAKGIKKASELAKHFGVTNITIYDIQKGRTWKHITSGDSQVADDGV